MKIWEFHPALVHFPIAFFLAAVALDLYSLKRPRELLTRAAAGLYVAGVLTGIASGIAGIVAWFTAPHSDEVHALMYWHPALALAMLAIFTVVAIWRWKGRATAPRPWAWVMSLVGTVLLLVAGYLGGYLVYHGAAGVTVPGGGSHHHGEDDHPHGEGKEKGPRPPSAGEVLEEKGHEDHKH